MASKFQEIGYVAEGEKRDQQKFLTIGRSGSGKGELSDPTDVAVDKDGNIAVLEKGNKRVQIFDAKTGQSLRCFPVHGPDTFGIDIDSSGQFIVTSGYISDHAILVYSREGKLTKTLAKDDWLRELRAVAVLKDGRMVVTDVIKKSCCLLQPDGSLIREFSKFGPPNPNRFEFLPREPLFIAVDESRGRLFVTDSKDNKVCVFDLEGNWKFNIGQGSGEFQSPKGITVDPKGNIILASHDRDHNRRLQVFSASPDGKCLGTVATMERLPWGIALTPDGYIAVACREAHCVELYRYE